MNNSNHRFRFYNLQFRLFLAIGPSWIRTKLSSLRTILIFHSLTFGGFLYCRRQHRTNK